MRIVRRLVALLGLGLPPILLTSYPVSNGDPSGPSSAAHAQGQPAQLEFFLPPARTTPPLPPAAPRALPAPGRAPAFIVTPQLAPAARAILGLHPSPRRRAWQPGLFTVARVGRRLIYQKGYLGDVPVHVVIANLDDPDIKLGVMVAGGGVGCTESFAGMMQRAQPAAAITGTFFGVKNGLPTGDLVVNGHAIYRGFVGTAIAFTEGNLVAFIPTGYKEKTAWRFFDGVMRAGPLLVHSGHIAVGPREEGFTSLSPAARRPRTAVGITPGRKLLLLAVREPISLWRLAKLMRALGAYHAAAMDGGSSTGLYFHGRMIIPPARALTNALLIYADRRHYQVAKATFLGGRPQPAALPPSPAASTPALVVQVQPVPEVSATGSGAPEVPLVSTARPTPHSSGTDFGGSAFDAGADWPAWPPPGAAPPGLLDPAPSPPPAAPAAGAAGHPPAASSSTGGG